MRARATDGRAAGGPGPDLRGPPAVSAGTRVLALLGDPVAHSLSPAIQNAAIREAGLDGIYVAIPCGEAALPGLLLGLAAAGGAGNVTLPHKERAAALVEAPTDAVRRTGACNTFWEEGGRVHGDNTDVEGFRASADELLGGDVPGRCLVLGAGGAARSVLVGLLDGGAGEILLWNRTAERARAVARRIGGERVRVVETREEVEGEPFDLVVNATRLGLEAGDPLPVEPASLGRVGAVLDLVYRDGETAWVRAARELGIRARDGGEMLVRQGAAAFRRWWDREPPLEAMRHALGSSAEAREGRRG